MTTWTFIPNWINNLFGMATSVTPSKTLVPLPPVVVGATQDDAGNTLTDALGQAIIGSAADAILSAIYALADKLDQLTQKVNTMSESQTQAEADIATIVAADATFKEAFAKIMQIISNPPSGIPLPAADFAALHAAATNIQADAAQAQSIAAGTATATASST